MDESKARQIVAFATEGLKDDDAHVFTDTGWFQLDYTKMPSGDELASLQSNVGDTVALEPPSYWDPVADPSLVQLHRLGEGDSERDAVVIAFLSSFTNPKKVRILKVERVQNLAMYQSYVVKRQTICYRETGGKIGKAKDDIQGKALARFERRWLWHGTNKDIMDKILQQGFNRSFCGQNETAYGKGVYFSCDAASYLPMDSYAIPDAKGNQYVMACRVVVGEYCIGRRDALTPDIRDYNTQSLYDSTVGLLGQDTMANPSIYVTYHDAQAYPEYLIKFKIEEQEPQVSNKSSFDDLFGYVYT